MSINNNIEAIKNEADELVHLSELVSPNSSSIGRSFSQGVLIGLSELGRSIACSFRRMIHVINHSDFKSVSNQSIQQGMKEKMKNLTKEMEKINDSDTTGINTKEIKKLEDLVDYAIKEAEVAIEYFKSERNDLEQNISKEQNSTIPEQENLIAQDSKALEELKTLKKQIWENKNFTKLTANSSGTPAQKLLNDENRSVSNFTVVLLPKVETTPEPATKLHTQANLQIQEEPFSDHEISVENPKQIEKIILLENKFYEKSQASFSGNKTKGLQDIANVLAESPLGNVFVPKWNEISHNVVYEILNSQFPEIFGQLDQLSEKFELSENKPRFLDDPKVKESLKEIGKKIENAFLNTNFDSPELNSWLQTMNGHLLMVRSDSNEDFTAKEGARQISNAGAHLTEACVQPKRKDVLDSTGRVVASYFGINTLDNQIQTGRNPFTRESLQLSVLLQKFVGETPGNKSPDKIPSSVVFFTTEPDDSSLEEGFRVSTFSCTFGHGEGVVNNEQVKTDTIYGIGSRINEGKQAEVYQKKSKPQRLAPVQLDNKVKLQLVDNPPGMSNKRALSKEMVQRLMDLGALVEKKKGCPMDMEIVILGDEIHIVQMREIKRKKPAPTYLSDEAIHALEQTPILDTKHAKVLVSGLSAALKITSKKEILHCKTLKEADDNYVEGKHKMVIVDQDEPALSHPVINFREKSIPCFFSKQDTTMLLKQVNPQKPLVACPQSGRICLWNQNLVPLESCVKPGFFSHPAYMEFTTRNKSHISSDGKIEVPKEITEALLALKTAKTDEVALKTLKELQQHPKVMELKGKISRLENENKGIESLHIQNQIKILKKIDKHIQKTFAELEGSYTHEAPRLEKLFHIKRISTLLQGNETESALDGTEAESSFSLLQTDAHIASIDRAIAYQKKLSSPAKFVHLLDIDALALNAKNRFQWEKFLHGLETQTPPMDEKAIKDFNNLMQVLEESGSLPLWLNMVFMPKAAEIENLNELLAVLIPKKGKDADAFAYLQNAIKELNAFDTAVFSDPQRFNKNWESARGLMKKYASPEMLKNLSGSELNQYLTLGLMRKYVDCIDQSIKKVIVSPAFSKQEKAAYVDKMLKENYPVMKVWIENANKLNEILMKNSSLEEYFESLETTWSKCDLSDSNILDSTKDFSVLAATAFSGALQKRHPYKTLGDLFSLIHQNQLSTLAHLNRSIVKDQSIQELSLPKFMSEFPKLSTKDNSTINNIEMTGADINQNGIIMKYNVPLNNHSLSIELECNKKSEMTMHVKFFGERGLQRWRDISIMAECMNAAGLIDAKQILPYTDQEIQFSWDVRPEHTEAIIGTLPVMAGIANGGRFTRDRVSNFFKKFKPEDKFGEKFALALFEQRTFREKDSDSYLSLGSFQGYDPINNALIQVRDTYGTSNDPDILDQELDHLYTLKSLDAISWADFDKLIPKYLDKEISVKSGIRTLRETNSTSKKQLCIEFIQKRISPLERQQISNSTMLETVSFLKTIIRSSRPLDLKLSQDEKINVINDVKLFLSKLSPEDLKQHQVIELSSLIRKLCKNS